MNDGVIAKRSRSVVVGAVITWILSAALISFMFCLVFTVSYDPSKHIIVPILMSVIAFPSIIYYVVLMICLPVKLAYVSEGKLYLCPNRWKRIIVEPSEIVYIARKNYLKRNLQKEYSFGKLTI